MLFRSVGFSTRLGTVSNLNRVLLDGTGKNIGTVEKEHYGVDLEYKNSRFRTRAEYLWARDGDGINSPDVQPEGFYTMVGYRLNHPIELLGRYEGYSATTGGPSMHKTTLGLTYFFSKLTELYFNYEFVSGNSSALLATNNSPLGQSSGLRLRLTTRFP